MAFESMIAVLPFVQSGNFHGLGDERDTIGDRPEFPSVAEAGVKGYESIAWYGMVGRPLPGTSSRGSMARCAECSTD